MVYNYKIFFLLFNFSNKSLLTKKLTIFFTNLSKPFFLFFYILGGIYILFFNFNLIIFFKYFFVPLFLLIFIRILKVFFNFKRPFQVFNITPLVFHSPGKSFPSNHSASSCVISFSLGYLYPPFFIFFLITSFFTSILRIMVGVHFPVDVFFGFIFGLIFGTFGFFIF